MCVQGYLSSIFCFVIVVFKGYVLRKWWFCIFMSIVCSERRVVLYRVTLFVEYFMTEGKEVRSG